MARTITRHQTGSDSYAKGSRYDEGIGDDLPDMLPEPKPGVTDLAEAAARRASAVKLRLGGRTYADIAEELGYASPSGARQAVLRALDRVEVSSVDEMRALENERLDRAQAAIWRKVLAGDLRAVETFLRITARRATMNGLDAPKAVNVSTSVRGELEMALDALAEVIEVEVLSDEETEDGDE